MVVMAMQAGRSARNSKLKERGRGKGEEREEGREKLPEHKGRYHCATYISF